MALVVDGSGRGMGPKRVGNSNRIERAAAKWAKKMGCSSRLDWMNAAAPNGTEVSLGSRPLALPSFTLLSFAVLLMPRLDLDSFFVRLLVLCQHPASVMGRFRGEFLRGACGMTRGWRKRRSLSSLAAGVWSVRKYYERGFFRDRLRVLTNQRAGGDTLCISGLSLLLASLDHGFPSSQPTAKPCSI